MAKAKKLKSGNWRTQVYSHTDSEGKKHYRSFTAATKKESEYLAAQFGLHRTNSNYDDYTVMEILQMYIDCKEDSLSPNTITGYNSMLKNRFTIFNNLKVKNLSSAIVQKWIGELNLELSPKSVRNAYGLLTSALNFFDIELKIKVKLPQLVVKDCYIPIDSDVKTLISYLREHNHNLYIACLLSAFGTLRRGEICALTADDVKGNVITVNKTMVKKGSEWIIRDTPKTKSSNRHVEYADFVIKELPTTGRLVNIYPTTISEKFAKTVRKLNLNHFRFHDLRHYSASIMHAIGIPDVYIMQRGGWGSDKVLKQIYRNKLDDYNKTFTAQTNEYFEKVSHEISHEQKNFL